MNPRRVATLLRERARVAREAAELDEQLADAYEGEAANDAPVKRRARPVTDLEKARARKALRKVGLDV